MEQKGRIEDGIFIFDEPYKVKWIDWVTEHGECDAIMVNKHIVDGMVLIVAYAMSENSNSYLRKNKCKYKGNGYLIGVPWEEGVIF